MFHKFSLHMSVELHVSSYSNSLICPQESKIACGCTYKLTNQHASTRN